MKPPFTTFTIVSIIDQLTRRPECIETAGEMPKLEPRPMPRLAPGAQPRPDRMPLWRPVDKLGD